MPRSLGFNVIDLLSDVSAPNPSPRTISPWDQTLPEGRIIATNGEAGFQAQTLAPGVYFAKWFWQYDITFQPFTINPTGKIGLVLARDGAEPETGSILARKVPCDSFQDAQAFLTNGGRKGRQTGIITPGSYRINTPRRHDRAWKKKPPSPKYKKRS